jgi:hypothetical protein
MAMAWASSAIAAAATAVTVIDGTAAMTSIVTLLLRAKSFI